MQCSCCQRVPLNRNRGPAVDQLILRCSPIMSSVVSMANGENNRCKRCKNENKNHTKNLASFCRVHLDLPGPAPFSSMDTPQNVKNRRPPPPPPAHLDQFYHWWIKIWSWIVVSRIFPKGFNHNNEIAGVSLSDSKPQKMRIYNSIRLICHRDSLTLYSILFKVLCK